MSNVPEVIEAQEFRVVDNEGNVRATLGVTEEGCCRLTLEDGAGTPRAELSLWEDGSPSLFLCDAAGIVRVTLSSTENGPKVGLIDAAGNTRAVLEGDNPCFWLYDEAEKVRVGIGILHDGPGLKLFDAAEKVRAHVGCARAADKHTGAEVKYPESTLTLYKDNGEVLWQTP